MPKAPSLIEEIVALVPTEKGREKPWQDKIDPAVRAELEQLKSDWKAGKVKGTRVGMARAISETLKRRGVYSIGVQGVTKWLTTG